MATQLQDLQAKRKELQATNPNATMLDAKSALSPTPIANAPVAGVAPAITLTTPTAPVAPSVHSGGMSPTEQANRDILAKNQTTAPVAPTVTPEVTTPTTPTVTPTETPTVAPTVAPEPTVQVASQAVQAPTPTQAVKSPTQATNKAILEQNKLKPPSTRDIALSNKLGQYSAMTSQQFVDLMKQGQIPSTVSSQLVANPQFQQAQQEYSQFLKTNNINNSGRAVYNAMTGGQPEQAVNPLVEISNNLLKAFGVDGTQGSYLDAFKESISQNEAVRTKTLELNAKNAQIDEKVQARDNILKDLKATHQGVPLSTLVAMASRDAQPINDEITTLQRDVKQLSSDLQFETELAKSEYDAKTKDMEAKTNIRNTILGNLMNAQFGLATKQMEAQMADQIAKQAFNDPLKAIPAMVDEYKKLGIPFERSVQELVTEFQSSGQDLASYLTDLQRTVQSKPEYKQMLAQQAAKGISYQTIGDKVYKNENGILTETNINTRSTRPDWIQDTSGNWIDKNTGTRPDIQALSQAKGQTLLDAPDGMVIPSRLSETTNKNGGKECAEYVNDITGIGLGNSWDSKKSKIDNTIIVPETGDTAIWIPDPSNKTFAKYGHAGVVTGVSEDGSTVTIKSSNLNGDGAISTITVPISQIDQTGGFAHSSVKQTGTQSTEITQGDISIFNNTTFKPQTDLKTQAQKDKYKKFLEEKNNVMSYNNKDVDIKSILAYSAGGKELTDATIKPLEKFNSALDQIGSIQEQISKMDTGPILGRLRNLNPYDTDAQVLKAQLTALMPTVARGVYGEVGVLTDNDIRLYAQTIPNLTNTNDVNKAVLAMSLKVIAGGYKRQLQTLAAAGKDVSGFSGIYDGLMSQVQSLESEIGVGGTGSGTNDLDSIYNSL